MTSSRIAPITGNEYLESICDNREVWIYGERVKDVTTHAAFRNGARMIARLYDALHDPARRSVLTTETDDDGFTHKFFKAPTSAIINPPIDRHKHPGGRHELYERNYAGNNEAIRFETLSNAVATGAADKYKNFAEQCMSEYDLDGWKAPDLINPDDVNVILKKFHASR